MSRIGTRILLILTALGWVLLLLGYSVTPYAQNSGGMEPTIRKGDLLLATKHFLMGSLRRGDLVVLQYPPDPRQTFIKRVVGLPGDRLRIADKQLILNGAAVTESYAVHLAKFADSYRDTFPSTPDYPLPPSAADMLVHHTEGGDVVVPPRSYFVLGDNRDGSLDSRYLGFVPAANVIGRPVYVYRSKVRGHAGPLARVALR